MKVIVSNWREKLLFVDAAGSSTTNLNVWEAVSVNSTFSKMVEV